MANVQNNPGNLSTLHFFLLRDGDGPFFVKCDGIHQMDLDCKLKLIYDGETYVAVLKEIKPGHYYGLIKDFELPAEAAGLVVISLTVIVDGGDGASVSSDNQSVVVISDPGILTDILNA